MSVTPLYSAAELDEKIAKYKLAEDALAFAEEYTTEINGIRQTVRRSQLPQIREHLKHLQNERVKLEVGHGPQFIQGRAYRG